MSEILPGARQSRIENASDMITIERAQPGGGEELLTLYEAAELWMHERGIVQWPLGLFRLDYLLMQIDAGTFYVARHSGRIVGALVLQWSDVEVWGARPDEAGYVHRLVVARDWTGRGLGRQLLDWAARAVAAEGRQFLRLDCIAENRALRAYYTAVGFEHQGDVYGTWSASLFQKRVGQGEA